MSQETFDLIFALLPAVTMVAGTLVFFWPTKQKKN